MEKLAALEHEQWIRNTLPYSELSEEVKVHDRKWARQVLFMVANQIFKDIDRICNHWAGRRLEDMFADSDYEYDIQRLKSKLGVKE